MDKQGLFLAYYSPFVFGGVLTEERKE